MYKRFPSGPNFSYYSYFFLLFSGAPTFPYFFLKMPYYPYVFCKEIENNKKMSKTNVNQRTYGPVNAHLRSGICDLN